MKKPKICTWCKKPIDKDNKHINKNFCSSECNTLYNVSWDDGSIGDWDNPDRAKLLDW